LKGDIGVLRKAWIFLKLLYSYIVFLTFPTPDENLCIMKGNCYVELGWYERAIKTYRKAMQTPNEEYLNAIIGYCQTQLGQHNEAVQSFQKEVRRSNDQKAKLGLALEEYELGNVENSEEVIRQLRASDKLSSQEREILNSLEIKVAVTKKARDDYKKERH
jgi:tetratricopeptide (TPR) repeat protein